MDRRIFWYEFLILWGIVMVGDAIQLLLVRVPPAFLATQLYFPLHPESSAAIWITYIVQVGIQFAIATAVGLWAAHRIGLGTPVLEAWLQKRPVRPSLRALLLPVIGTALLLSVFSNLPDFSTFHPNRKQRTAEVTAFFETDKGRMLEEQLDKLEPPPRRLTVVSQTLSYAESAVSSGIYGQLFMVSIFVLLALQIRKTRGLGSDTKVFWAGIVIVTAIRAIGLIVRQLTPSQIDQTMLAVFPNHRDPFLLVAARGLLPMIPSSLSLGWLYVRYGLEAAILAGFMASVLGYLMFVHVFVHLV